MSSSRRSLLPVFLIIVLFGPVLLSLSLIPRAYAATVFFQGENWTSDDCIANAVTSDQITGVFPNQKYSTSFDPTDLGTRECLHITRTSECAFFYECNFEFTFSFNYGDWVLTSAITDALANSTLVGVANTGAQIALNFSKTHQDNFEARLAVDPTGISPSRYTTFDYGNQILGSFVGCLEYVRIFTNVEYQIVVQHTNSTAFDVWIGSDDLNEPLAQWCNYGRITPIFPDNSWPGGSLGDPDGGIFLGPLDMPDTGTATGEINLFMSSMIQERESDGSGLNEDAYGVNLFKVSASFGRSVVTNTIASTNCGGSSPTFSFNNNDSRVLHVISPALGNIGFCAIEGQTFDITFLESVQGLDLTPTIRHPPLLSPASGVISGGIAFGDVAPSAGDLTKYRLTGWTQEGPSGQPDATLTAESIYARINGTQAGGPSAFFETTYFQGAPRFIFDRDGFVDTGSLLVSDLQIQIDLLKGYFGIAQILEEPRDLTARNFRLLGDSFLTAALIDRTIELWVFYTGTVPGEAEEGPQGEVGLTPLFSRTVRAGPNATGVSCPSGSFSFVGNNSFTLDSFMDDQSLVGGCQLSYVTFDVSSFDLDARVSGVKLQFDAITSCSNPRRDFMIVPVSLDNSTIFSAETVFNHINRTFARANPYATPNPCSEVIQNQGFFTLSFTIGGDASQDLEIAIATDGLFSLGVTWGLSRFIDPKTVLIDLTLIVNQVVQIDDAPPNPFGSGLQQSFIGLIAQDEEGGEVTNQRTAFALSERVFLRANLLIVNDTDPSGPNIQPNFELINFFFLDEFDEEFVYWDTCQTADDPNLSPEGEVVFSGVCTVFFDFNCCFTLAQQQIVTWVANYTGNANPAVNSSAAVSNEIDLRVIEEGLIPQIVPVSLTSPFFVDNQGNTRSTFTHFERWTIKVFLTQETASRDGFEVLEPLPMQTITFEIQINGEEAFTFLESRTTDNNGLAETRVRSFDERFIGIQRVRAVFEARPPYQRAESPIYEVFVVSSVSDMTLTLRTDGRTSFGPGDEVVLTGDLFVSLGDLPADPVPDIQVFLFLTDDRDLGGVFFELTFPTMVDPVVTNREGIYDFSFILNNQVPRTVTIFANATINSILLQSPTISLSVSDQVRLRDQQFGEVVLPGLEIFVPNEDFGIGVEGSNFIIWLIETLALTFGIPFVILLGIQKKGGTTDMSWVFMMMTGIFMAMTGWGVVSGMLPIWVPVMIAIVLAFMIIGVVRGGRGGGTV